MTAIFGSSLSLYSLQSCGSIYTLHKPFTHFRILLYFYIRLVFYDWVLTNWFGLPEGFLKPTFSAIFFRLPSAVHSFRNTTTTSQRGMGVVGGKSTSQQHNFTPWSRGRGGCGRGRVVSRPTAATTCPLCANSPPAHQIWHRKNDDIKEKKKNHPNAAFEPANNAHHNNAYFYFLSNIKYFKIKLYKLVNEWLDVSNVSTVLVPVPYL